MRSLLILPGRILLAVLLLCSGTALAQENAEAEKDRFFSIGTQTIQQSGAEVVLEQREKISDISKQTDKLEAILKRNSDNDAILVDVRTDLESLARELLESGVAFRPRLADINKRLDEIGPPRGEDDAPEPPALTEERKKLIHEKAEINALLGEAESVSLRVNRLIAEIVQIRRDLFKNTLSRRYDISVAVSPEVLHEFNEENARLYQTISSWLLFVSNYKLKDTLLATLYALLAAGVMWFGGRRLFGNIFNADPDTAEPSYISRLSVAFWSTLLPSAALAVFLAVTYFFYNYYNVFRYDIAQMTVTLFNVVAIMFFVHRLSNAVFAPAHPQWRLLPVRSGAARTLLWLTSLTALVTGGDFVASKINDVMGSPLSLTVAKSFFATVFVGILVIMIALVRPYEDAAGQPKKWPPFFRGLFFLVGGGTIIAALLGYIGLARFISQQIVITSAILATMYIGYLSAGAISEIGAFSKTKFGRRISTRLKLDETSEDQLALVISIIINVIVLAVGIPLIFLQWGFQWGDIQSWVYNVAREIRIGSISISLIGILSGLLLFLVGYFGTRGFQRWLDSKVMARGRMDAGVRNSIGTAVGYAGIALAALVGISAAGIDLSSLALIAGALSLGIGFGLQNIINNFVSGLILLAERPFKVGDWIVAGGVEGNVRKISVRATEIETFRRQTVILPNSELINSAVGNWTLRNRLGRVDIPVTASYENDPRKVHQLLLDIVSGHPQVLRNPAPSVSFDGVTDSTMSFTIRVFVSDISSTQALTNDVRFTIVEKFKEKGIAVPSRDLAVKGLPEVLSHSVHIEAEEQAETAPRTRKRKTQS